jgi:hypothetical protein
MEVSYDLKAASCTFGTGVRTAWMVVTFQVDVRVFPSNNIVTGQHRLYGVIIPHLSSSPYLVSLCNVNKCQVPCPKRSIGLSVGMPRLFLATGRICIAPGLSMLLTGVPPCLSTLRNSGTLSRGLQCQQLSQSRS